MTDPEIVGIRYAQCFDCEFPGEHRDPPEWHTWAGPEDIAHAAATGQPDPTTSRCACPCAVVARRGSAVRKTPL